MQEILPMVCSTRDGDLSPALWAMLTSVSVERMKRRLWVGRSMIWQNTIGSYKLSAMFIHRVHVTRSKFTQNFFVVFISKNAHTKYSKINTTIPYENFPLCGILISIPSFLKKWLQLNLLSNSNTSIAYLKWDNYFNNSFETIR